MFSRRTRSAYNNSGVKVSSTTKPAYLAMAWAAGKFDAERIAKSVKEFDLAGKVGKKLIVLPGHVAVLSGELEEELPGWDIRVGPREAVDIPAFLKTAL